MKTNLTRISLVFVLGALLGACSAFTPGQSKPTVSILAPASNSLVTQDQVVIVQVAAQDANAIVRVELNVGDETFTLPNPAPSASFTGSLSWRARKLGPHTLTARAFNASGVSSDPVSVLVVVNAPVVLTTPGPMGVAVISTVTSVPSAALPSISPTASTPVARRLNHLPAITKLTSESAKVAARSAVRLSAEANDPDGDRLSYHWSVDSGARTDLVQLNGPGPQVDFVAPRVPSGLGMYKVSIVVKDGAGASASATITIQVVPPEGLQGAAPDLVNDWSADSAVQDVLGFSVTPVQKRPGTASNPPAAEQHFQNGYMFWYHADYDGVQRIYAIYNGDHTWSRFADTWREGVDPDYQCTTPPTPPQRGFGKVWCFQPGVKEKLGRATEPEIGVGQLMQNFENGMMLRSLDYNVTYVLFNDGTWR